MPDHIVWTVQAFERRNDVPVAGRRFRAAHARDAVNQAEAVARTFGGAAALCLAVDEGGAIWSTTVVAVAGEVPPDLSPALDLTTRDTARD